MARSAEHERVRARYLLGLERRNSGDLAGAAEAFETVLTEFSKLPGLAQFSLREEFVLAAEGLAEIEVMWGRNGSAIRHCLDAVTMSTRFREGAHYWAARAHAAEGDYGLAEVKLRQILQECHHPDWLDRALDLLRQLPDTT